MNWDWLKAHLASRKSRETWAGIIVALLARIGFDVEVELVLGILGAVAMNVWGIAREDAAVKTSLPAPPVPDAVQNGVVTRSEAGGFLRT